MNNEKRSISIFDNERLYYLALFTTIMGSVMSDYIVNIWTLSETGSTKELAYIMTIASIPLIFLTLASGIFSDKMEKRRIMFVCDIISGFICLFAYLFLRNEFNIVLIGLMSISLKVVNNMFSVAAKSILPELTNAKNLTQINSNAQIIKQVSKVIFPLVANVVVLFFEPSIGILLNSCSFFISAILEFKFKVKSNPKQNIKKKEGIGYSNAVKYILKEKVILRDIILALVTNFWMAGDLILFAYIFLVIYDNNMVYTLSLMLGALGSICGAIYVNNIQNTKFIPKVSTILIFISLVSVVSVHNMYYYLFLSFLYPFAITIFNISFFSQIQAEVTSDDLGKVLALIFVAVSILNPAGLLMIRNFDTMFGLFSFNVLGLGLLISICLVLSVYNLSKYKWINKN